MFVKDKAIGAPLISLHAVPDLSKQVQEHIYFLRFENMVEQSVASMWHIFAWLGLPAFQINPEQLKVGIRESDSHYRIKYLRKQSEQIIKPVRHDIPSKIHAQIETAYAWFYQMYYPKN